MIATSTSVIAVGLGDLFVSKAEDLVAYSLGSCVGICLWDPIAKVAAMAHVVLPTAPAGAVALPGKFGDTAVPALLEALTRAGGLPASLSRGGGRSFIALSLILGRFVPEPDRKAAQDGRSVPDSRRSARRGFGDAPSPTRP